MGQPQFAPDDVRRTNIHPDAWSEPIGYVVAPAPRGGVTKLMGGLGTLPIAYVMMSEQEVRLSPFLQVLGWLWVKGCVESAQSRGGALDW